MTNALIGLPVGAYNLEKCEQTFTFSGKDGTIPVFALFCGDEFVGKTVGWKETENTGGTWDYQLSAGQLSWTQRSDAAGTWRYWNLLKASKLLKISGLVIEAQMSSSVSAISANSSWIWMRLRDPASGYELTVRFGVQPEATAGAGNGLKWQIVKYDGTWTVLWDSGFQTEKNIVWKIEFTDGTWKVSTKIGTETTFTERWSGTDWIPVNLLSVYLYGQADSTDSITFTSDYIKVTYPTFTIAYDQPASDVSKGDVKVYDTRGQTNEALWQQVFDVGHLFSGECVIENGLVRVWLTNTTANLYFWNGSAWQSFKYIDILLAYSSTYLRTLALEKIEKITPEEVKVQVKFSKAEYWLRAKIGLRRGMPFVLFESVEMSSHDYWVYQLRPDTSSWIGFTPEKYLGRRDVKRKRVTDSTMIDNYIGFLEPADPIIAIQAMDQKPSAYFVIWSYVDGPHPRFVYADHPIKIAFCLIPFSNSSNLVKEAEDATLVGGETNIVRDDFTDDSSASYTNLAGTISFQTEGSASDSFTGDGTTTTFQLTYYPIVPDSQTVKVDGVTQTEDTDYSINDGTGELTFTTAPASGAVIEVTYTKRGCIIGEGTAGSAFEYINKLNSLKFGAGTYEADLCICNPNTTINQDADLVFGCQDADNFYMVAIGRRSTAPTNVLRLVKKVAGSWTILGEDSTVTVDYGTFYHVKVDWSPSTGALKVYWAGETNPRISVTDTTFDAGAVGARLRTESASGNADLAFDNLYINAEEVLSSGNSAVILDADNDRVYYDLVAGTDIPYGRYLLVARLKDTANVTNDIQLVWWNATEGKALATSEKTLTSTYAFYSLECEVREAYEAGDKIRLVAKKWTGTDNRIAVDYVFLVPLSNCLHFPMDIAHSCMRDVSVKHFIKKR